MRAEFESGSPNRHQHQRGAYVVGQGTHQKLEENNATYRRLVSQCSRTSSITKMADIIHVLKNVSKQQQQRRQ